MKTQTNEVANHDRKMRALELRKRGWSIRKISEELGYKAENGAWSIIKSALKTTIREAATEVVTIELERIDALVDANWDAAMDGDLQAAHVILKAMERRAKLLGLDAPVRKELTGKDGVDLFRKAYITVSPDDWDDDGNRDD